MTAALAGQRLSKLQNNTNSNGFQWHGPPYIVGLVGLKMFSGRALYSTRKFGIIYKYGFCYVTRRDLRPERYWEERYDNSRHPVSFWIALPYQGR